MASLGMNGPYPLNQQKIDEIVTQKSLGNYALGYETETKFIVKYVGRSDHNVNERLHDWENSEYKEFKFSYASSAKKAFEKECKNYHDFGESKDLDNDRHPDRSNVEWKCPVCNIFG